MEEQIVKFEDILKGCFKRWKMIITMAIILTAITAVVTMSSEEATIYKGEAKILIKNPLVVQSNGESKKDTYLVQNNIELMKTREFLVNVVNNTGLKLTPELILSKTKITNIPNSDFIKIEYSSVSKEETLKVIDGIIKQFTTTSKEYNPDIQFIADSNIGITEDENIKNNGLLIIVGLFGGLGVGAVAAFVLECVNKTFRTKGEVERALKMPVIGSIPKVKAKDGNVLLKDNTQGNIISESYNNLTTNIKYRENTNDNRVILVTSSLKGEGSTTTASRLALSLIAEQEKVILVEGNLRKPSIHEIYNVDNNIGLSDVVLGKEKIESAVISINENLDILTAGSSIQNPLAIINSIEFDSLLESLKGKYNYIVIDSPAVKIVTDSTLLATKADCTLLVVRAEKSSKDIVKESIELINSVNGNIVGIVLNAADTFRNKFYKYQV